MKTTRPVLHARDHLPGGADPILPSPFGMGFPDYIRTLPSLQAWYRLGSDDPAGDALDSSGHDRHLTDGHVGSFPPTHVPHAELGTGDDQATMFNYPQTSLTAGADSWLQGISYPPNGADTGWTMIGFVNPGVVDADETYVAGLFGPYELSGSPAGGAAFFYQPSTRQVTAEWRNGVSTVTLASAAGLTPGSWYLLALVWDNTADTVTMYVNGVQVATAAASFLAASQSMFIGMGDRTSGGLVYNPQFYGAVDEVAVFNEPLTADQIGGFLADADSEGLVLGLDENGNPAWVSPTVEVSGGGVNPAPVDETPADSSNPAGSGPTTSSGWHLDAHVETVVLHDPNPGRFDVPTMKWVRVPFTSITIYRTWEPTVDAEVLKTARLKDDRGLMQAAKNGILHINPDMAWPGAPPMNVWLDDSLVSHPEHHLVEGWFSIEYPVLDARYLPENDVELLTLGPTPDAPRPGVDVLVADGYQRAARFMNVSTGSVLRFHAGSTDRSIINWWFWGTADESAVDGDGPGTGNADNPLPIWGDWPARPVHMSPPYPQLNPTDSKAYYHDYQGMAGQGFGPFRGLTAGTNLSAGANLCMQAWQDSPWLLRFSTARFPAYRGFDQDYNGFPHLAVTYHYDPDTINHTTGRLLLPAT